jgi:type VI secretion system protein VasD
MAANPLLPLSSTKSRAGRWRGLLGGALLALGALAGCSSGPAVLKANVTGSAQLNTDARKRPSPVVVRVYELKATTAFDSADFVSLFEKEQAVLGAELVAREEFVLRPGETKVINKVLSPDTRFIGVLAAYRELERSRWHVTVPVATGKENEMSIQLGDVAIDATRTKPKMK